MPKVKKESFDLQFKFSIIIIQPQEVFEDEIAQYLSESLSQSPMDLKSIMKQWFPLSCMTHFLGDMFGSVEFTCHLYVEFRDIRKRKKCVGLFCPV